MTAIHVHSLILPQYYVTGLETEDLNDALEHTSQEIYIPEIQEKTVNLIAIENITAGAMAPLLWWVELSPVPSAISAAYWAAIGGGGGGIAPTAPQIIAPTGVTGTLTPDARAFTMHSAWMRVVVQSALATPLTAFWQIQVIMSGKTT